MNKRPHKHQFDTRFHEIWFQVDLHALLAKNPLPLSQGLLSSLLQHLNNDISDMSLKLAWLKDVAAAIKPSVQVETIAEMYYQPKTS
ncbi:hypothetical protein F2Q70_00028609 [Brassica cretica]|uniref:Uncharacterized protein n=1 Tax=Brassica cretica TaxID=69181 RepID=A0A8S9LEA2_BRACR|nr:hypothetical protein F2Q70_00028609 [Brassica cretica]